VFSFYLFICISIIFVVFLDILLDLVAFLFAGAGH
jgi:hypothetical protein